MNAKFHTNCENTGKILKISFVRCNLVNFDIHFHLKLILFNSLIDSIVPLHSIILCER